MNFYEQLKRSAKEEAWRKVQENKELADFLKEINKEFGKPSRIVIEINNLEVWRNR